MTISTAKVEGSDNKGTEVYPEKEAKAAVKEKDEQKDHKELSFDEIVSKTLRKKSKRIKILEGLSRVDGLSKQAKPIVI